MAANKSKEDRALDEAIAETFPASDPPANTVETGIRVGDDEPVVADNRDAQRFEVVVNHKTAFLAYERRHQSIVLLHTEVPDELRGRHLGSRLVEAAIRAARADELELVVVCPFVREYVGRHQELLD